MIEKKEFKLSTILGWFDKGIGKNEARQKLYDKFKFNTRTVEDIMKHPKVKEAKVKEPLQVNLIDDTGGRKYEEEEKGSESPSEHYIHNKEAMEASKSEDKQNY